MTTPSRQAFMRLGLLAAALGAAALLSACVVEAPPRYVQAPPPRPQPVYEQPQAAPDNEPVVSVYVDPPLEQPAPIAVQWAPPPMLVEVPPPQPYAEAVWTGGYWAWEGRWFWSAGRWAPPPQPSYTWVQPYYEHRGDVVVFVPGFWCAPQRHFVPPPVGLSITVALAAPGVHFAGRPPMGPQGVFVPPPPGSRAGIIVPAPLGTPPAVVVSAPPVVNVGMRVHGNVDINSHNTVNNVTNITNVTNVTIEAPAGATANGQAFQNSVPARAHLAASLAPAGRPAAPQPSSQQAIPTYQSGHAPMALPAGQPVRNDRFAPPAGHPAQPPAQAGAAPQGQFGAPQPGQGVQPHPGQGRPEFDQPPRTPAPVNGQQPAWQQGQQPQQGQQGQQWQQRPNNGQPVQGQPQPAVAQPGQPQQQVNPQDPRRRGGNPQGQPGAQPGQPGQPASQAQPPKGHEGKQGEAKEKDERRKTEHERPDDRKKENGERDR